MIQSTLRRLSMAKGESDTVVLQGTHGACVVSGGHEGGILHCVLRRVHPVLEAAGAAGRPSQSRRRRRGACHRQPATAGVSPPSDRGQSALGT